MASRASIIDGLKGKSKTVTSGATEKKSRKKRVFSPVKEEAELSEQKKHFSEDDTSFERIPLNLIRLDHTNARTRYLDRNNPTKNPFESGHPRFEEYEDLISGIKDLASHFEEQSLLTPIAVYKENNRYYVSFGNRRFLGLLVSRGETYAPWCKVSESKPKNLHITRIQENSAREDLAPLPMLEEFKSAYDEACRLSGVSKLNVTELAAILGTSASNAWMLKTCSENESILQLLKEGVVFSKRNLKEFAKEKDRDTILNGLAGLNVDKKPKPKALKVSGAGRPKTTITLPKKLKKDPEAFKQLIKGQFASSFEEADFESIDALLKKLETIFSEE